MNTLTLNAPANTQIDTLDARETEEKRYAIKCILDHYEALGMSQDDLFNRACTLWELELISIKMVLSICIDQLVFGYKKST